MKLMFASDIHGSSFFCKKMLEAYRLEEAERLVLLGDILYHGPRNDLPKEYAPKEVIAMLNPLKSKIYAVRGNCVGIPCNGRLLYNYRRGQNDLCQPWSCLSQRQSASFGRRGHFYSWTYPCTCCREISAFYLVKSGFRVFAERGKCANIWNIGKWNIYH